MQTNQKTCVRASLALLALCGFSTFGVSTIIAADTDLNSGYKNIIDGRDYGQYFTAVGSLNIAEGTSGGATAVGTGNTAMDGSSAVGSGNKAEGITSNAMGCDNTAEGQRSNAFGFGNNAKNLYDSALGAQNKASGSYSSAVGASNKASGERSSALGYGNVASEVGSTAVGFNSIATGSKSAAMGSGSYAGAEGATAIGYQAVSTETGTVSFGHKSGDFAGYYKDDLENTSTTPQDGYNAVNYDSDSFARLTNIAEGYNDNDAVNFSQIKTEAGTIIKASTTESGGKVTLNSEGTVGKNLKALDDAIVAEGTYGLNDDKKTITVKNNAGNTAFTLNLDGISGGEGATYTAGDNVEISDDNVISVKADGKVEAGNEGIVTGGEVYDQVSGMKSDLEGQINKVGAGAAALAALHPGTYDPMDKMTFAVGFGHYKDANAGALGAFYRPNADTLISFAGTVGNGDPMLNVGFSFKLGERGLPDRKYVENSDVARIIDAQDKKIVAQEKKIAALEADNQKIKAQMAEILKKLELSDTVKKTVAVH